MFVVGGGNPSPGRIPQVRLFPGWHITLPLMFPVPTGNRNRPVKSISNGESHSRPIANVSLIIGIDPVLAGAFEVLCGLFDIINAFGDVEVIKRDCRKHLIGCPSHGNCRTLGPFKLFDIIYDRPMTG